MFNSTYNLHKLRSQDWTGPPDLQLVILMKKIRVSLPRITTKPTKITQTTSELSNLTTTKLMTKIKSKGKKMTKKKQQ